MTSESTISCQLTFEGGMLRSRAATTVKMTMSTQVRCRCPLTLEHVGAAQHQAEAARNGDDVVANEPLDATAWMMAYDHCEDEEARVAWESTTTSA